MDRALTRLGAGALVATTKHFFALHYWGNEVSGPEITEKLQRSFKLHNITRLFLRAR